MNTINLVNRNQNTGGDIFENLGRVQKLDGSIWRQPD